MLKKGMSRMGSTTAAIVVALILAIGAYLFPMRTSLGQGIDERVAVGWEGVLDPSTNQEFYRMTFQDGSYLEYPVQGLSHSLFSGRTQDGRLTTKLNVVDVIVTAYKQNPKGVEQTLGTYHNVPSLLHPFNEEPVAYTASLLGDVAHAGFNLSLVGGPNIPPGIVQTLHLGNGVLHIDTASDGNTLAQCQPGQRPSVLTS